MTFSYSGNPSQSDLDHVRFLIGDTADGKCDRTKAFLSNEEINFLLDEENDIYGAAYRAVLAIIARLSREYDQAVGQVKYSLSQRVKHYRQLADQLKEKFESRVSAPYCGGISESDKETNETDQDTVKPKFNVDLHSREDIYRKNDLYGVS
jgi:hypothetical protein